MTITSQLLEAYVKCPTKCWLKYAGEQATSNAYAAWAQARDESCRAEGIKRLVAEVPEGERVVAPPTENLKTATWRVAADLRVQAPNIDTRIPIVEREPSFGRGKAAQFIPIRFVCTNKVGRAEKLLLAFDCLALSKILGRGVPSGKIIHGDDHAMLKVKTSDLVTEIRTLIEKAAALLSSASPPDLILTRHCPECEFQTRCHQKAVEKDDLSLLALMTEKERKKFHNKGIFTIAQLSYTFRPRRRPKRLREKREKYHHSIKALAIRENKIHIVGSPELKIEGTPVFLDVEGLPDRDFYYLIGLLIGNGESAVRHSLWADTVEDEGKIWREFLGILNTVERPVLIHYGSYEQAFVKNMSHRHEKPLEDSVAAKALGVTVNLVSFLFAQFYFPTASNSLKGIAGWLGCAWPAKFPSGLHSIICRHDWEISRCETDRQSLIEYNAADCAAVDHLVTEICRLLPGQQQGVNLGSRDAVHTDSLKCDLPYRFGKMEYAVPEFEYINQAAYWDYQREKVQFRTARRSKAHKRSSTRIKKGRPILPRITESALANGCPKCNGKFAKWYKVRKVVQDLKFTRGGLRRTVVQYVHRSYKCQYCGTRFTDRPKEWPKHKEGSGLLSFVMYQLIQQRVSRRSVADALYTLFGFRKGTAIVDRLKKRAFELYRGTRDEMLLKLVKGHVLHADETHVSLGGKRAFIWVFCDADETIYLQTDNREGAFLGEMLKDFNGVFVSDFYAAYDSLPCPQQKCLVHLLRDLNGDLLKHPFDEDMKWLANQFGLLLKPMIETVDQFGLKARFLRKHQRAVSSFFKRLHQETLKSDLAQKYRKRFESHQDTLFTFLEHDGVPWNNNNAEHAVKAFVMLRKQIGGASTKTGIDEYLVMLGLYETCRRKEVSFLDFLRSGETDIHAFAETSRGRKRRAQTTQPPSLPGNPIPDSNDQS